MQTRTQKIISQTFILITAYFLLLSYFYFTSEGRLAFTNNQIPVSGLLVAGVIFYFTAIAMKLNKALKLITTILVGFFILEFILKLYFWIKILLTLQSSIFTENFASALLYLFLASLMLLMLRVNKTIE